MGSTVLGRFLCGAIASLFVACGGGGSDTGPSPKPIPASPPPGTLGDGRLAQLVDWARDSQGLPALGVVVIRNGQVIERAVMGRRSASASTLATIDDQWHVGSITKSMTATLAALLVEDWLISARKSGGTAGPTGAGSRPPGFRGRGMKRSSSSRMAAASAVPRRWMR